MREAELNSSPGGRTEILHLPAPTVWPLVLGLGIVLCLAGLITSFSITALGLLLAMIAGVGWFKNVLPHEKHEAVAVAIAASAAAQGEHAAPAGPHISMHREVDIFPTFSFVAGIEAGLAGGVAMAVPATIFSVVKYHSLWYASNLMAAGGFVGWTNASDAFLGQFHLQGLLAAVAIHSMISVLMGLLYGAVVPMFPRRAILTGGIMAPLLWTGLAYGSMNSVSPILSGRVDWWWFVVSQVAFGMVAGFVVDLRVKISSAEFQALPFAQRAGLHSNQPYKRGNREVKR